MSVGAFLEANLKQSSKLAHVLKHLGSNGVPVPSQWTQDSYMQHLKHNKVFENDHFIAFTKPAFSRFSKIRTDLSFSNSTFIKRFSEFMESPTPLLVAKCAPLTMSGIVLLAKDREQFKLIHRRVRREKLLKRKPFTIDSILVGSLPGVSESASEENEIKFWTQEVEINGIKQLVAPLQVTKTQIKRDKVKICCGCLNILKLNYNRAHAQFKISAIFTEAVSIFALQNNWAILGDHLYSHRLSYLNNEIKPVDPHKCPSDRPQRLPDDVRKDLKLQSDLVHHLPLCSHFSRIDLEKSKDSPELSINSPFPDYFSDCIKLLC